MADSISVELLAGDWWHEEFPLDGLPARVRPDAIAVVRDGDRWCQLVPVRPGDAATQAWRVWSIHFPDSVDHSGFIGWLAALIKERTGSGVLVVSGQNGRRGGIFDYWACPATAAGPVLAVVFELVLRRTPGELLFDGRRMRASKTASGGQVDAGTLFSFAQAGSTVWAHYAGGAVEVGYLVGRLDGTSLRWRYAQVDRTGNLHGGRSTCSVESMADGRLRLLEHFQWESRPGSGTNVLEDSED